MGAFYYTIQVEIQLDIRHESLQCVQEFRVFLKL